MMNMDFIPVSAPDVPLGLERRAGATGSYWILY